MVVFISIKESIERIADNHIWLAKLKGGFDNTTQSYCAELLIHSQYLVQPLYLNFDSEGV